MLIHLSLAFILLESNSIDSFTKRHIMRTFEIDQCAICKGYYLTSSRVDASDEGEGWYRCPLCGGL